MLLLCLVCFTGVHFNLQEYVKGHSGQLGNEKADSLAKMGAKRYKGSDPTPIHPWQQYFA